MNGLIRCSELDRFMACPSFLKTDRLQDYSTIYAKNGIEAHKEIERRITNNIIDDRYELNSYVEFIIKTKEKGATYFLERYKSNDHIHGTADCVIYLDEYMYIIDYKNGYQEVKPDCYQLFGYAILNLQPNIKYVVLCIFQNGEFKKIKVSASDVIKKSLEIIEKKKQSYYELGDHCMFCSRVCPLQVNAMSKLLGFTPSIDNLIINEKIVTKFIKKIHDSVYENDIAPDGYVFDEVETKRRYIKECEGLPDLLKEIKPIGVTLLEKYIKEDLITKEEAEKYIDYKKSISKRLIKV